MTASHCQYPSQPPLGTAAGPGSHHEKPGCCGMGVRASLQPSCYSSNSHRLSFRVPSSSVWWQGGWAGTRSQSGEVTFPFSTLSSIPKENEGEQAAKAKSMEERWRAAVGLLGSLVEIPPRDWKGWGPRCWAGVCPSQGQSQGAAEPQHSRSATEVRTSHHGTATAASTKLCQLCSVIF